MKHNAGDIFPPIMITKRNKAPKESKLSMNMERDMLSGNIIFGKYTFLIKPSCSTRAPPDCNTIEEKHVHGTIPPKRKTVYVLMSTFNIAENATAVTAMVSNGLTSVQR